MLKLSALLLAFGITGLAAQPKSRVLFLEASPLVPMKVNDTVCLIQNSKNLGCGKVVLTLTKMVVLKTSLEGQSPHVGDAFEASIRKDEGSFNHTYIVTDTSKDAIQLTPREAFTADNDAQSVFAKNALGGDRKRNAAAVWASPGFAAPEAEPMPDNWVRPSRKPEP